jgi:hypothetical protein
VGGVVLGLRPGPVCLEAFAATTGGELMSDYMEKTMLLVAKREDEDYPMVIGAMPRSTWEVFDIEEWDRVEARSGEAFLRR